MNPDNFHFLFIGGGVERKDLKEAIIALQHLPKDLVLSVVSRDEKQRKYVRLSERLNRMAKLEPMNPNPLGVRTLLSEKVCSELSMLSTVMVEFGRSLQLP